jgi:hypothetical protein
VGPRHCGEEKNLLLLPGIKNMKQNTVFFFNIWRNSQRFLTTSMCIGASTISSHAESKQYSAEAQWSMFTVNVATAAQIFFHR